MMDLLGNWKVYITVAVLILPCLFIIVIATSAISQAFFRAKQAYLANVRQEVRMENERWTSGQG